MLQQQLRKMCDCNITLLILFVKVIFLLFLKLTVSKVLLSDFVFVLIRDNIGYPIAECAADGKFILSKPPNTGGLLSPSTVAEQVRA